MSHDMNQRLLESDVVESDVAEEEEERRKGTEARRRRVVADCASVTFVLLSNFTLAIQYSLLMPTVWKYIREMNGDKIMLGFVLAAYTLAQCCTMPIIGQIGDKIGVKRLYYVCYTATIVGSFMYGISGYVGSPWMCLVARFVTGIGASANVLNTACVAKWSSPKDLNKNMNLYLAVRMIGNIIGPGFMVALSHVKVKFGFVDIKDTTSPGYVMMIPNAALLIMAATMLTEIRTASGQSVDAHKEDTQNRSAVTSRASIRDVLIGRGAWFPLMLQFTGCFGIGLVETALTPMTNELGWDTTENSFLFVGISIVIFLAIIFSLVVKKCDGDTVRAQRYRPRRLIMIAIVFGGLLLVYIALHEIFVGKIQTWSLFVFTLLGGFPIPLMIGPSNAIYASKLEESSKGQFMSYVGIAQSLGRTIGPLAGSGAVSISSRRFWPLGIMFFATWILGPLAAKAVWSSLEIDLSKNVDHDKKGARQTTDDP